MALGGGLGGSSTQLAACEGAESSAAATDGAALGPPPAATPGSNPVRRICTRCAEQKERAGSAA